MEDAKSRKVEWKRRLAKLELESLLSLRDTLMASGAQYLMVINDSKKNAEQITKYVSSVPWLMFCYVLLCNAYIILYVLLLPPLPFLLLSPLLQLSEQQRAKKEAAQTGFALRVTELEKSIQQYKQEQQTYDEKLQKNSEVLNKLRVQLEDVDKRVRVLRPGIKLSTLDERCKLGQSLVVSCNLQ